MKRAQAILLLLSALVLSVGALAETRGEPPLSGPVEPKVEARKGDDGIWHQDWFQQTFLELKEDHAAARGRGKTFAVVFEQRGCIYCTKMHTEILAQKYINDYVRENFEIVQLDLFGSREVTDFDGRKLPEKALAERWGVLFTPTIVFIKEDLTGLSGQWGAPLEVARMSLGFGAPTFIDLFGWVRTKAYEKDRNFQRYHIERMQMREQGRMR